MPDGVQKMCNLTMPRALNSAPAHPEFFLPARPSLQEGLLDHIYQRSSGRLITAYSVRLSLELARKYDCPALLAKCQDYLCSCSFELTVSPRWALLLAQMHAVLGRSRLSAVQLASDESVHALCRLQRRAAQRGRLPWARLQLWAG